MDCDKCYIGQAGCTLSIQRKEHIRSLRCSKDASAYANHTYKNTGPVEHTMHRGDAEKKTKFNESKNNITST